MMVGMILFSGILQRYRLFLSPIYYTFEYNNPSEYENQQFIK